MRATPPPPDFTTYLSKQVPAVQPVLVELRKYILMAAPNATELINYGIPAFALVKGGNRDQQIMIAGYRHHVGMYPHPAVIAKFGHELAGYKTGKGSVQFPINYPLPQQLIMDMVRYRLEILAPPC